MEVIAIKTDLFLKFNNILDKEAKRISKIILKKYESKTKVNMSFENIVRKYLKKEYRYYEFAILVKIHFYIPNRLTHDPIDEYALVTKEDAELRHINSYAYWCMKKFKNKNPKEKAILFAKTLIADNNKYRVENISLLKAIEENMSILYLEHHDSVDARALVLFLQDAIESLGYEIKQIDPLIIEKKKENDKQKESC